MNNKPVAWMYESKNVDGKPYISDVSLKPLFGLVTRYGYKEIPLYTHPAELTDEEILKLTKLWFNCHPDANLTEEFAIPLYSVVNLCKAILRKAQEK